MNHLDVTISPQNLSVEFGAGTLDVSTGLPVLREAVSGGLPLGGQAGDIIVKQSATDFDAAWVAPANSVERDNTLPITSAAVYTEVGNINILLATI